MELVCCWGKRAEDTLRKYAMQAASKLERVGSWDLFVGRPDLSTEMGSLQHKKAAGLMGHPHVWHPGPWEYERIQQAALRGSHRSTKDDDVEFVCLEMLKFCKQGFWTVLPLRVALQLRH